MPAFIYFSFQAGDLCYLTETLQWETCLPFSYFHTVTIRSVTNLGLQQLVNNDTALMEVEHKPQ